MVCSLRCTRLWALMSRLNFSIYAWHALSCIVALSLCLLFVSYLSSPLLEMHELSVHCVEALKCVLHAWYNHHDDVYFTLRFLVFLMIQIFNCKCLGFLCSQLRMKIKGMLCECVFKYRRQILIMHSPHDSSIQKRNTVLYILVPYQCLIESAGPPTASQPPYLSIAHKNFFCTERGATRLHWYSISEFKIHCTYINGVLRQTFKLLEFGNSRCVNSLRFYMCLKRTHIIADRLVCTKNSSNI